MRPKIYLVSSISLKEENLSHIHKCAARHMLFGNTEKSTPVQNTTGLHVFSIILSQNPSSLKSSCQIVFSFSLFFL